MIIKSTAVAKYRDWSSKSRLCRRFSAQANVSQLSGTESYPTWTRVVVADTAWESLQAQRQYVDWVQRDVLRIQKLEDWYNITPAEFSGSINGRAILNKHAGSLFRLLEQTHPEHPWQGWLFKQVDKGFWAQVSNQRAFLQHLQRVHSFAMDDWYRVSGKQLHAWGAGSILQGYKNSVFAMLAATFPEHDWIAWKFSKVPRNYWKKIQNRQKYFTWLGAMLGFDTRTDLYRFYALRHSDLVAAAGSAGILESYRKSLCLALIDSFPEHKWQEWKFAQVPQNFWQNRANVRRFLDDLVLELGLRGSQTEKLLALTSDQVRDARGGFMLASLYGGSMMRMLSDAYPEFDWNVIKAVK